MKKGIIIVLLFVLFASCMYAQDSAIKDEYKSDLTYISVPVFRTYDQRQAYVVMFQRNGNAIGQVLLPKQWFKMDPETKEKKGYLRSLPKLLNPYMTVVYKGGEFHHVVLYMPINRNDSHWSVIVPDIELVDKMNLDTIEINY